MVVITLFPKKLAARAAKFVSGALFEEPDEFPQIGVVAAPFGKNVHVIGHETEGMQPKRLAGREEEPQHALGGRVRGQVRNAAIAADGDEVGLAAEVVLGRKARDCAMDGHREGEYTRTGVVGASLQAGGSDFENHRF